MALALVACGGGAGDDVATEPAPPPSEPPVERPVELAAGVVDEGSGVPDRVVAIDAETGDVLRELYLVGDGPDPKSAPRRRAATPETSVHGIAVEGGAVWFVESGVHCGAGTIYRVPLAGGPVEAVVESGAWPAPSPDGGSLAYVRGSPASSISCADEIVVVDLASGEERVFAPPPATGTELALSHLEWASDSRRLAYAAHADQSTVAVLDTSTASSQADAVVVDPDGEAFPGCLSSPTWGPEDTLLMLGMEPRESCAGRSGDVSVVAVDLDTLAVERRSSAPHAGTLRADASGQHLLLSAYDHGVVELNADGTVRQIVPSAEGADW